MKKEINWKDFFFESNDEESPEEEKQLILDYFLESKEKEEIQEDEEPQLRLTIGFAHLLMGVIIGVPFSFYWMRTIDGYTKLYSIMVYILLMIMLSVVGVIFHREYKQTVAVAIVDILCATSVYTIGSYKPLLGDVTKEIIGTVVLCMIYILYRHYGRYHSFNFIDFTMSFVISIALVGAVLNVAVQIDAIRIQRSASREYVDIAEEGDEVLLKKLDEKVWAKLNFDEKLEVMAEVIRLECKELGFAQTFTLNVTDEEDPHYLAFYRDENHSINITEEHLKEGKPFELVDSTIHELFHAYQYRLIDMYNHLDPYQKQLKIFEDVETYKEELKNYKSEGIEYFEQVVEMHAYDYASLRVDYYKEAIDYLLES